MNGKRFFVSIVFLLSLLLLTACNVSEKDALGNAELALEQTLEMEPMEGTAEGEDFTYYIPSGFNVDEDIEGSNNVVLNDKEQLYILFVNPFEQKDSKVVYESTLLSYNNVLINESFMKDNQFVYLIIDKEQQNDGEYEVTFGIGGVKITTVTDTNNMEESVRKMVEIVSSVTLEGE